MYQDYLKNGGSRARILFLEETIELPTCCNYAYFKEIPMLHAANLTKYNSIYELKSDGTLKLSILHFMW